MSDNWDKGDDASKKVQADFAKATGPSQHQQAGSDMVKKDRPQHNLNPPSPMRGPADQASYNARLNDEAQKAKAQELKARIDARNNPGDNTKSADGKPRNDDRSR